MIFDTHNGHSLDDNLAVWRKLQCYVITNGPAVITPYIDQTAARDKLAFRIKIKDVPYWRVLRKQLKAKP